MAGLFRDLVYFARKNRPDLLPISQVFKQYDRFKAVADLRAGINVALVAFPQSMAYAMIAGLSIGYGLYGVAIASIIGSLFIHNRFLSLGPSNSTAVLVASLFIGMGSTVNRGSPEFAGVVALLTVMVGLILLVSSYLKAADLSRYVSQTVIVGYISGAALLIIANQIHNVLGFKLPEKDTFYEILTETLLLLDHTHYPSLFMGLATFACYYSLKWLIKGLPNAAVTLALMSVGAHYLTARGITVEMLSEVKTGTWPISLPVLDLKLTGELASGAMAIAFLTFLQSNSIAKSIANRTGETVRPNQDMFGLGMSNLASGLFGGMPAAASLVRSGLNWTSGASTVLANIYCGIVCGGGVLLLGHWIAYIPKPALSAIVIVSATSLIDLKSIRTCLKTTQSDGLALILTFFGALLLKLDFAIFLGVTASIGFFLRKAAAPHLVEYVLEENGEFRPVHHKTQKKHDGIAVVQVEGELFFGAADIFRDEIRVFCRDPKTKVIILRLRSARNMDATTVMALEDLVRFTRETHHQLILCGVTRSIYRALRQSDLLKLLGPDNIFTASHGHFDSTSRALKRAQLLVGQGSASTP